MDFRIQTTPAHQALRALKHLNKNRITTPKFNSEFTPETWCLEGSDPFLLGPGNFSGANC